MAEAHSWLRVGDCLLLPPLLLLLLLSRVPQRVPLVHPVHGAEEAALGSGVRDLAIVLVALVRCWGSHVWCTMLMVGASWGGRAGGHGARPPRRALARDPKHLHHAHTWNNKVTAGRPLALGARPRQPTAAAAPGPPRHQAPSRLRFLPPAPTASHMSCSSLRLCSTSSSARPSASCKAARCSSCSSGATRRNLRRRTTRERRGAFGWPLRGSALRWPGLCIVPGARWQW